MHVSPARDRGHGITNFSWTIRRWLKHVRLVLLMYFNNQGRAEVTRILFTLAGQDFEDVRLTDKEWSEFKQKAPLRQLPILQIDNGKMIPQSSAIAWYVAREFGFGGSTNVESLKMHVICDTATDLMGPLGGALFGEKDETKKAEQIKDFYDTKASFFLQALEGFLVENEGGDGFFVGKEISIADIAVFVGLDTCFKNRKDLLEKYQKLLKLSEKVADQPRIAEYLGKRPNTLF